VGIDNENTNPAALAEFESYREISEVLEDAVNCVVEMAMNGVDARKCILPAVSLLGLPPPGQSELSYKDTFALVQSVCERVQLPTSAELDRKQYVLVNTEARARKHAEIAVRWSRSIIVAATRRALILASEETVKLEARLELEAHLESWSGTMINPGGVGRFEWSGDL
jgi:hypothetical protein